MEHNNLFEIKRNEDGLKFYLSPEIGKIENPTLKRSAEHKFVQTYTKHLFSELNLTETQFEIVADIDTINYLMTNLIIQFDEYLDLDFKYFNDMFEPSNLDQGDRSSGYSEA